MLGGLIPMYGIHVVHMINIYRHISTYIATCNIWSMITRARSDLSLNAMSVKLLNHPQCNKPMNMLIWGIAPGTYRDEVFPYPMHMHMHMASTASMHTHFHTHAWASTLVVYPVLRLLACSRCSGSAILHTTTINGTHAAWSNYSEA
jgi:hypothetical protein